MSSALASLLKNVILITLLIISALDLYYNWFGFKELLSVQLISGLIYVFLSCYEILNSSFKASLPVTRFAYLTSSFLMFRTIKIGAFLIFGIMLISTETKVEFLMPICFIISLTEAIVTFIRYKKSLCFINIYANYILIAEDGMKKIFASEIKTVEFRHNVFYLITNKSKTLTVATEYVSNKNSFLLAMQNWLTRNKLDMGDESKEHLNLLLNDLY
ncbi:MAG: hypothetical protein JSU07_13595 [Bacteroidetes bacterium]|nr:hypothetical protein [Bacteroidota bacterium]